MLLYRVDIGLYTEDIVLYMFSINLYNNGYKEQDVKHILPKCIQRRDLLKRRQNSIMRKILVLVSYTISLDCIIGK